MNVRIFGSLAPALVILLIAALACNLPAPITPTPTVALPPTVQAVFEEPTEPLPTPIAHLMKPAALAVAGSPVYDVVSRDTAPEKRAPYGDSYELNRLERPFLQDMTYAPNLDVSTYNIGQDKDWVYVTIALIGSDPNDALGIDYAVELDTNEDGYGDYILWGRPPYPLDWDTAPVEIYQDSNHNTSGLSAAKSDAVFDGDGYDRLVFSGGMGDADPDLAWVRVNYGMQGSVQFAFKRSWSGNVFMLGVLADAGLRDPGQLDYVDRIPALEAGSPVRSNRYYPLKALYAVDNTCRSAVGFASAGNEPQSCPVEARKPPSNRGSTPPPNTCQPNPQCLYGQNPYPDCSCIIG
jgi:hypothetical protein